MNIKKKEKKGKNSRTTFIAVYEYICSNLCEACICILHEHKKKRKQFGGERRK